MFMRLTIANAAVLFRDSELFRSRDQRKSGQLRRRRRQFAGANKITAIATGMKIIIQTLTSRFQDWVTSRSRPLAGEPPLRAELFSVEQLARHAKTLAASHQVVTRQGDNRLLAGLDQNEDILRAFNHATLAMDKTRRITPAAEWLLDNFYLIEEQIQLARRHLPRGYSRELPRLVNGPAAGLPGVYDIELELISHVDAQIDAGPLSAFIAAYQTVASLKLGELWAIPIMLRLGLIENLQRVTTRLNRARDNRDLADSWVDRLQQMPGDSGYGLGRVRKICQRLETSPVPLRAACHHENFSPAGVDFLRRRKSRLASSVAPEARPPMVLAFRVSA